MVGITQARSLQDEKLIEAIFQTHWSPDSRGTSSSVYGATATNLIIDARPTVNAVANTAKGAGTENMEYYKDSKKVYLGIDHIHTMRDSLAKVVEALRDADQLLASINNELSEHIPNLAVLDRGALRRSGWLRHLSAILEGTLIITKNIHINSSHVLIHCSDGWDRTSQLSAMAQICLDPYYRTIRGFEILVEKDWLSYGHKFLDRCGHLSSEKFFSSPTGDSSGSGADAAQAFLASVQNRFASQNHIKETSPIFHQFLEAVRQVQRQFPDRFEFNERFLRQLYYHLYSCQFGTFLFNCERDRRVGDGYNPPPVERTISVWDLMNSPEELEKNKNPSYDPTLDDPTRRDSPTDMGVLLPNPKDVRFWNELYGRTDEEMNGRVATAIVKGPEIVGPIESPDEDPVTRAITPDVSPDALSSSAPPNLLLPGSSKPDMGRSPSPGILSNVRDLASSLPDLAGRGPVSTRVGSSSSPTRRSNSPASTSQRSRPQQPQFNITPGVMSVWGKLSSNASAAFTAVQDAYSGVAKDLRNTGTVDEGSERISELRGRENLSAWGDETNTGSQRRPPSSPLNNTNPWVTTSGLRSDSRKQTLSIFDDNPWGSVADRKPPSAPPAELTQGSPLQPTSPLPLDPTIPAPLRQSSTRGLGRNSPMPAASSSSAPAASTASSTGADVDPLGVGFL